jgi:Methylase of polypeptide chain release factors
MRKCMTTGIILLYFVRIFILLNHESSSSFCTALQSTIATVNNNVARRFNARGRTSTTTGTTLTANSRGTAGDDTLLSNLAVPAAIANLRISQRRSVLSTMTTSIVTLFPTLPSIADTFGHDDNIIASKSATSSSSMPHTTSTTSSSATNTIFTRGFGKEEYTNSITASRDTNISPKEVYDSIQSIYVQYPLQKAKEQHRIPRAWDVGAGAGVSTQTLYNMGYLQIEAVDWSSAAWEDNLIQDNLPSGVRFTALDDESFVQNVWNTEGRKQKFDVIVFNFGINDSKARRYAQEMLMEDGRLFAPVNVQSDYWLKQAFKVYDVRGNVLWSVTDVGAWSVQFQPDVTQDTCQGIWCAPYNGFQKNK